MRRGRPLVPLTLTDEQQDQLNGIARSPTLPYALVQRAQMVLASAEGLANSAVARRFGVTVKLPQLCGATPRTQKATFSSTAMIGGWRDRPVLDLRLKR